jgi:hypothetical protein
VDGHDSPLPQPALEIGFQVATIDPIDGEIDLACQLGLEVIQVNPLRDDAARGLVALIREIRLDQAPQGEGLSRWSWSPAFLASPAAEDEVTGIDAVGYLDQAGCQPVNYALYGLDGSLGIGPAPGLERFLVFLPVPSEACNEDLALATKVCHARSPSTRLWSVRGIASPRDRTHATRCPTFAV